MRSYSVENSKYLTQYRFYSQCDVIKREKEKLLIIWTIAYERIVLVKLKRISFLRRKERQSTSDNNVGVNRLRILKERRKETYGGCVPRLEVGPEGVRSSYPPEV